MDTNILDAHLEIDKVYIENEIIKLQNVLLENYKLYRGDRNPVEIKGKNIILVGDGIATGYTLLVTLEMLRKQGAAKIIVAVPVLPYDTVDIIEKQTDEFYYLI